MAAEKKYPGIKALNGIFLPRSEHPGIDAVFIGLPSGKAGKAAGSISITKAKNQPFH
jgi:hypothetical protein